MRVLAGDIGGTKTLLAEVECAGDTCRVLRRARYTSADFDDAAALVGAFLGEAAPPERACLAVAGPVDDTGDDESARLTNLPWSLSGAALRSALAIPRVRLINDLQATGYGIAALAPTDLVTLQAGAPVARAPRVVLGAGTGLGQCLLVWRDDHHEALPTEGGHADFAPGDALQRELLAALAAELGHVSWERVCSGAGIARIYRFLAARAGAAPDAELAARYADGDPTPVIGERAVAGSDPLAVQSVDMFLKALGAQAGNLALTTLARGGVFLAGGIPPRLLPQLDAAPLLAAFRAKGRMSRLAASMPVHVITNTDAGLLGAALAASRL